MEALIFIVGIAAIIAGIMLVARRWSNKSAQKVKEIRQEAHEDTQQPLQEPPPISAPEAEMTNDELRKHIDQQFRHVEQLISNLHKQHEKGRVNNVVRMGEWFADVRDHFDRAGSKALTYLFIGVAVSIVLTLLTGWDDIAALWQNA